MSGPKTTQVRPGRLRAEQIPFNFEDSPFLVKNVEEALNAVAGFADKAGGGIEGADGFAGPGTPAPTATGVLIGEGNVITDNGIIQEVAIVAPGLNADYTVAADQAGDGVGGAFVPPVGVPGAAGIFLAVHLIVTASGVARLGITNVAPIPEDSVPTFLAQDVSSKILAIFVLRSDGGGGNEFLPQSVDNVGPDLRRTTFLEPTGSLAANPSGEQVVSATGIVPLNGVPGSDVSRPVEMNIQAIPAPAPVAADSVSFTSAGGTAPVAESVIQVITIPGARVSGPAITDPTGRGVHVANVPAQTDANVRVVSFTTSFSHPVA